MTPLRYREPTLRDALIPISREARLAYWPKHMADLPVVLVDFDGVLATNTWPSPALGSPDPQAIRMVQHYAQEGCEVHVFTARPPSHWPRIWRWLEGQQIEHLIYDVGNVKKAACLYFDDRAVRWPL